MPQLNIHARLVARRDAFFVQVEAAKLRLKPTRNFAANEAPLRRQQYLFGPLRGPRHLLRLREKLASFVTILALGDV